MPNDWLTFPEGNAGNTNQDPNSWLDSYAQDIDGSWEDYGIFERNSVTGETRLKDRMVGLSGLSSQAIGHYERDPEGVTAFKPYTNVQIDEDNILDNEELDRLGRDFNKSSVFDWVDLYVNAPASGIASTIVAPLQGIGAAAYDVSGDLYSMLGMDDQAAGAYANRDVSKDASELTKETARMLLPPSDTGMHPVKEIYQDLKDVNPVEFYKDAYSFVASTAAPMVAIALAEAPYTAALGAGTLGAMGVRQLPKLAELIYGTAAFDETYGNIRYNQDGSLKEGTTALQAAAYATPSAIIQGKMEQFSYDKQFAKLGSMPFKQFIGSVATEYQTEAGQGIVGDLFSLAPDVVASDYLFGPKEINWKEVKEWSANELGKAHWDGVGGAISASAVTGGNFALQNAGMILKNSNNEESGPVSLDQLDPYQREAVFSDMGLLKKFLEHSNAGPENWQPEHAAAVKTIATRWNKVLEVGQALKEVTEAATNPVKIGAKQALEEATPGGQDVEDFTGKPFDSAFVAFVQEESAPNKAGAFHTFVDGKKLFTTEEVDIASEALNDIELSDLAPSEWDLLTHSVNAMIEGTDSVESKAKLATRLGEMHAEANHLIDSTDKNIAQIFADTQNRITDETPVGTIAGLVQATADQIKKNHGRLVGASTQKAVTSLQDKLFKVADGMENDAKVATPEYRSVIQSIQKLNQFLTKDNVALAEEKYIEPAMVWKTMGEEVESISKMVVEDHNIAESAITAIVNSAQVDKKQQDALGLSPKQILANGIRALEGLNYSHVNIGVKERIDELAADMRTAAQSKNPDLGDIVSRAGELTSALSESKNTELEKAVKGVLANYVKAATVHAAKGHGDEPITLAFMALDGEGLAKARGEAENAKQMAKKQASGEIFKVLQYFKEDSQDDKTKLSSLLHRAVEGMADSLPEASEEYTLDKTEIKEATNTMSVVVSGMFRAQMAQTGGNESMAIVNTKDRLNRLFVKLGLAKSKKISGSVKNPKTGMKEVQRNYLFDYAKAKGILVPTPAEHGTVLLTKEGGTFTDALEKIRAQFDIDTEAYKKGTVEWDDAVANSLFGLISNESMEGMIAAAEGKTHVQGGRLLWKLGRLLTNSFPRGSDLPDELVNFDGETNFPKDSPEYWEGITAPLVDAQRAAIINSRLFNMLSSLRYVDEAQHVEVMRVIEDISGIGEYSRSKYRSTKAQWNKVRREMAAETRESLAVPSMEMRETSAKRDWHADPRDSEQWGEVVRTKGERWRVDENGAQVLDRYGMPIWEDPNDQETTFRKVAGESNLAPQEERTFNPEVEKRHDKDFKRRLRTDPNAVAAAEEMATQEDLRKATLLRFFNITELAGYRWLLTKDQKDAIARTDITGEYDQEARGALSYIEKAFMSVSKSAQNLGTPTGLAFSMAKNGYDAEEVTLALGLIVNMSKIWAKNSGGTIADYYNMATHMVVGIKDTGTAKQYGVNIRTQAFQYLKKSWIALTKKLETPSGRVDIFPPVHEFLHAMITSGQMVNMFSKEDLAKVEAWLGARLPRVNPSTGTLWRDKAMDAKMEERLIAGITMSVATTDFTRTTASAAKSAVMRVRDVMFDLFTDVYGGERKGVSFSAQNMMTVQHDIPEDVHKALVNIFGVNSVGAAAYRVSPTGVTLTAAHRLVGQIKAAIGIDISPLLEQKLNSVDALFNDKTKTRQLLKGVVGQKWADSGSRQDLYKAVDAGPNSFMEFLGANLKTIDPSLRAHLTAIHKEVKENNEILKEYEKILFNPRTAPVITQEDAIAATEDVYVLPDEDTLAMADTSDMSVDDALIDASSKNREEFDAEGYARERGEAARASKIPPRAQRPAVSKRKRSPVPRSEAATIAQTLIDVATPLAFQDSTEITEPLARILRTDMSPMLTGNSNMTGKNSKNIAVRALQLTHDLSKLFNTGTYSLEKYLMSKGLTREFLIVHNMGGLYSQARAALEDKVSVLIGPLGRERWTVIGESLRDIVEEMPEKYQQDVWTYLAAKREIEIANNAKKRKEKYEHELNVYNASLGSLPKPKEPNIPNIDPLTLAAAVLAEVTMNAKYGKNAGIVGNYAKRIADFSNNAIAKKLYHYGLLSREELGNLLKDGQWWIPQSYLKELTDDLETNDPFFNDGTKAALSVLHNDRKGTEHPFEELSRRVLGTHMLATRAFVRSSVIRTLVRDASVQDLAEIGITKITTEIPQRVDEKTYWETAPEERLEGHKDKATGAWVWLTKKHVDLDRRGYVKWALANPDKKKNVYAVWEDGKASYYEIADAQMRKAIDSMKVEELHPVLRFVQTLTNYIAKLITLAPKFILGMPIKDMSGASSRSQAGINILTAPYDLLNGLFHAMPNMFPSLGRRFPKTFWLHNERVHSMANQSSLQATFSEKGIELNKRTSKRKSVLGMMGDDLMNAFRESNESKNQRDAAMATHAGNKLWGMAKLGVKGVVELLERSASTADAALRLAERKLARQGSLGDISRMRAYASNIKNGETWAIEAKKHDQPGYLSDLYVDALDRQLTLDFSRKGLAVRVISTMKMFAGPMFQDSATTLERLGNPITRKAFVLKSFMAFTMPALMNWLRWEDDEDYQRLSYWDKLNFYQISKNNDGTGTFNQIPTGIGLASVLFKDTFITMAQIISDADPMAGKEWLAQLVEQTPLQYVPVIQSNADLVSHVAPTLLEPTFEVAMNHNPLSNSPIDYDKGKQNAPLPEDRGVEKFGITEKILASWFGTSPRVAGYWLRQSLPGLGGVVYGTANKLATEAYQAAGGDSTVGKQYNPVGTYLYKYWSGEVYGPASLPVNRFYDLYEKSANATASIEQAENNGSYDKIMQIKNSNPEWAYHDMFRDYYGDIQRMKIERGMYLKTVDPSDPAVKLFVKESFDKPMTLLAESATKAYYNIIKQSYNR